MKHKLINVEPMEHKINAPMNYTINKAVPVKRSINRTGNINSRKQLKSNIN